jgi:hypothetical protein
MELSRAFFEEHVRPLADARIGAGHYAAALLGAGSDVLGLDTALSADHDWGPRVVLLVDADATDTARAIGRELPDSYRGVSRQFGSAVPGGSKSIHPFEVSTVDSFFDAGWVGFHDAEGATLARWLSTPAMCFLAVTAGAVFHDGRGDLARARAFTHWYPEDIWRWLVGCQWQRIAEEDPFVGRAATVDDDLGGRIVTARLVRDAIRLAFLLDRRHPPYNKWLVTAFQTLPVAADLRAPLVEALAAATHTGRRDALSAALELLGRLTNDRLGTAVDPHRRRFFTRPFDVGAGEPLATAVLSTVSDPQLRALPPVGGVDSLLGTNNGAAPGAVALYTRLLSDAEATRLGPPAAASAEPTGGA